MSEIHDRFPLLEHLAWSRVTRRPRFHLGMSAIPMPPPGIFDPGGRALLDAQGDSEEELSERIARRYGTRAENVVLCAGVSEGLFLLAGALVSTGDLVLVEAPGYQSLAGVPRALGAEVRPLARTLDGRLDAEAARQTIAETGKGARASGRRLAAVFVSDLHNPTGARLDDATIDALAEASTRAGAVLVVDEVYRDVDSSRPIGTARDRHPEISTISSLTKAYGLGGLRLGWILAPEAVASTARRVQLYLSVLPSAPAVGLAIRALGSADAILAWVRPWLAANRERLARALEERPSGFVPPAAGTTGTTAFPYRPGGADTRAETESWLARRGLAVVPGAFFGAACGVRVGLGVEPMSFAAALEEWLAAIREPARA